MDEAVDIVLGDSFGDALSTLDVDVLEREVPETQVNTCPSPSPPLLFPASPNSLGRIIATDQVVDDIRVSDALLDGLGVAQVELLERWSCLVAGSLRARGPRLYGHDSCCGEELTIMTTLPKSPVTFRWRLLYSSRKGMMTVHPCLAVNRFDISHGDSLDMRFEVRQIAPSLLTM